MTLIDLEQVIESEDWEKLSPHIQELFDAVMFWMPDEPEDAEAVVYDRVQKGHCMSCDASLGQLSMGIINHAGIVMVFCCGQCMSDMQVMGWLEEKYEDIVQTVKFRGQGDGSDNAPEGS